MNRKFASEVPALWWAHRPTNLKDLRLCDIKAKQNSYRCKRVQGYWFRFGLHGLGSRFRAFGRLYGS